MSQAPAMPVYLDALISDTLDFSAEQFGAYVLLLAAQWRNNAEPLCNDNRKLARICRMSLARFRSQMRAIVDDKFTLTENGGLSQKRLKKVWETVQKNIQKQRDLAKARWLKNNETPDATAYATRIKTNNKKERGGDGSSLRRDAPPKNPALKDVIKEQLRQKLMRYANARLSGKERTAAVVGLMGEDPNRSAQSWFDALDMQMRAERWDDTRGQPECEAAD